MQGINEYHVPFEKTVKVLEKYNIPIIAFKFVKSPLEARLVAEEELNFPVVVKLIAPLYPHKSDAGLVALDVESPEEVERVSSQIIEKIAGSPYEGILVQEKARQGIEVVVGVNYDLQFGPVILFGAGGIFIEYLEDNVIGIPPLTRQQAYELIMSTKIGKLLKGVRNRPPSDIASLVDLILTMSRLAIENKDWIHSLDLNPVVVYEQGQGVKVLDFRLHARKPTVEV